MVWKRNEPDTTPSPTPSSPSPAAPPRAQGAGRSERAVIGSSITVEGDIRGEEDLTILGRVRGTVDVKGNSITVGQGGRVEADLHAKLIFVEGRVEGNLFGGDQIILRSTADVQGNLTAPRVALEDGAQFKGAIDMEPAGKGRSAGSSAPASPGSSSSSGGGPSGKPGDDRKTSEGSKGPDGSPGGGGGSKGSGDGSKKNG